MTSACVVSNSNQLPPAVVALARRLGADAGWRGDEVRLRQTGRMRGEPGAGWMAFEARQSIAVDRLRFRWTAKAGPAGLVRVTDALDAAGGHLRATLLGLVPLADAHGDPAVTRGELMRYLAELAWTPDAITRNPDLRWRVEAPDRLSVSAGAGLAAATVTLVLDGEGRIASASAHDRPRAVGRAFVPTPWRGRFMDYRQERGRWIPSRGEVGWIVDGAEAICWQGQVTRWDLGDPPFDAGGPNG